MCHGGTRECPILLALVSVITFEHVQYVLHSLVNYPDKISRIDRFLTTSLLNSVYTLMNSTFAGFEHNMGMKLL